MPDGSRVPSLGKTQTQARLREILAVAAAKDGIVNVSEWLTNVWEAAGKPPLREGSGVLQFASTAKPSWDKKHIDVPEWLAEALREALQKPLICAGQLDGVRCTRRLEYDGRTSDGRILVRERKNKETTVRLYYCCPRCMVGEDHVVPLVPEQTKRPVPIVSRDVPVVRPIATEKRGTGRPVSSPLFARATIPTTTHAAHGAAKTKATSGKRRPRTPTDRKKGKTNMGECSEDRRLKEVADGEVARLRREAENLIRRLEQVAQEANSLLVQVGREAATMPKKMQDGINTFVGAFECDRRMMNEKIDRLSGQIQRLLEAVQENNYKEAVATEPLKPTSLSLPRGWNRMTETELITALRQQGYEGSMPRGWRYLNARNLVAMLTDY